MVLEIIQREIPTRGIGYLILRDCPEERLDEGLRRGMEKLKRAGAATVLATSLPEGEPLHSGPIGVWRLSHTYDLVRMERPLPKKGRPAERLTLRPLKRSADDRSYVELFNRSCQNVPHARTVAISDLRQQGIRHGLVYRGEALIGCYKMDLSERVPEILSFVIDPAFRGQGLGRLLVQNLMDSLRAPACTVTLPSDLPAARHILESEGFTQSEVVTEWFEVV